jgi:hypothetical protein
MNIFNPETIYAVANTPKKGGFSLENEYGFGNYLSFNQFFDVMLRNALVIVGIVFVFYFLYSAFQYITSGGNKETTAAARGRITHSIIGLALVILVFLVVQFLQEFFEFNFKIF